MELKWKILMGIVTGALVLTGCGEESGSNNSEAEEEYPTQSISLTVPFSSGDSSDLSSRVFTDFAEEELGESISVENRDGAGGSIGHSEAAQAKADGYTLLTGSSGAMTIQPYTSDVGYTYEDFEPIGNMVEIPIALAVPEDSPYETLDEFMQEAENQPGELTYATPGTGVTQHIMMESMAQEYEVDLTHMPQDGGSDAVSQAVGGHVDAVAVGATQVVSQHESGDLKVLGVTSEEQYENLPDVPTFQEQDYDVNTTVWFGLFAPAGTPENVIESLSSTLENASENEEVLEQWKDLNLNPAYQDRDEFQTMIEEQAEQNKNVVEEIGLGAE
ncbi:tripartite tricarboxylate transporter substrate binding protein [Salibacterium aidingense]|uniref:tripartite tricarboxylate transporter substrate binding protein n=1 Tax=Salibacterium aidingense TaxID=384933 RepID=UPI003BCC1DB6